MSLSPPPPSSSITVDNNGAELFWNVQLVATIFAKEFAQIAPPL